ncbi:S8 family peptidase [Lysobacter niastensis]|uniref:S8 family serine peptidase n=1 Tax=Lysobacter niastensis TaxID=380629 RepID=A0ABS0BF96_9GAMM|nr:S8 family peptidase [Lysobacter niastensis]MBF6025664.1 S8 family serine peptidase [Lysobacter niastensis]
MNILGASALAVAVVGVLSATPGNAAPSSAAPRVKGLVAERVQTQFDRFIVRYKDGAAAPRTQAAIMSSFNTHAQRAGVAGLKMGANGVAVGLTSQYVRKMGVGADVIKLSRKLDAAEANALLAQLRSDPAVAYAEPDLMMQAVDFNPNDNHYGTLQWHYRNVSGAIGAGAPPNSAGGINMPKAWSAAITNAGNTVPTPNGAGVVVAVLDTGYVDHGDLAANIVPGYDFISAYGQDPQNPNVAGDGGGRDADAHDPGDWVDSTMAWCGGSSNSSWHGTHVAGTIAAVTNNAKGVAGVAYNAKVMPVRVLGHCGGLTSDIADAITWASGGTVPGVPVNNDPAEVINMSLGGSGTCLSTSVTQLAINGAISRGTTVVVAAGNNNADASSKTPASCAGVITVGATGVDASRAYYSNYGLNVTLSAPGGGATASGTALDASNVIWSTLNSGTTTPVASADGGDIYAGYVGTSMASPHVAGVVALIQSTAVAAGQPALTPALVRQVLTKTARSFPSAVTPPYPMGVGIVDANAAVLMAKGVVTPDPATVLTNRSARQITVASKSPVFNTTAGSSNLFLLSNVPAGKASINFRTYGGTSTSDVAIYVKRDAAPTTTDYDFKSDKAGTAETVMLTNPAAGNYYVLVVNTKASADEYVLAAF